MEPKAFYETRWKELESQLIRLKKRKSSFAWLRLGAIAAIIAGFYFLWSLGMIYVAIASVLLVFIFVRLVYADIANQTKIEHANYLQQVNENELKYLEGNYFGFPDGAEQIFGEHPYARDLDIFGRASLFQYLNRAPSEPGARCFAEYLKSPASISQIRERQEATRELSQKVLWIQELLAFGSKNRITFSTKDRLEKWIKEPAVFAEFRPWRWLRYVLPVSILSVVILYFFNEVGDFIFYLSLLILAIVAYQVNKVVAPIHEQLSKVAEELNTLSSSISAIELEKFDSPLLVSLQAVFREGNKTASADILKIKKILDKLDIRYNFVLSAPLNILLLWNLQQVLDLEKWKKTEQNHFSLWFDTLAEFEALNSIGILYFNHPDWSFPTIHTEYFSVEGEQLGHPLIPAEKRVDNYIQIPDNDQLMLVTGSNMAGKSTYLRSIGINVVLSMAGAPVCAKSFSVSHVQLVTSMRITDNLEESTSTFYAELKKLKTIIEKVNAGEKVFILLDEILRGTNSLDRHTGSKALIRQLIRKKAAAIIATHDLELAGLKDEFAGKIVNYHFDVQVSNDELFFDYRLKPGICNNLNASILMKKIGIEL